MLFSSFENSVAAEIRQKYNNNGNVRLTVSEVYSIVQLLAEHPLQKPYLSDARSKMASRDLSFREVYHGRIAEYLSVLAPEEFEKFIGN